eukprot:TRINITY_DN10974_c0_g1_i1.p1 TRINITY_DN10974_c0_g1~~TRINITY_DN10974_c0_g1_i1.p1  ORF type:complete len:856 (-),score=223.82 TRINITY_DN10974_c0_g1_i1:25-2592(-)
MEEFEGFSEVNSNFQAVYRQPTFQTSSPNKMSTYRQLQAQDMFSLGCTLYELFSTHHKKLFSSQVMHDFDEDPSVISAQIQELPPAVRNLIGSLLQRDADLRPTCQQILQTCDVFPSYFHELYDFLRQFQATTSSRRRLFLLNEHIDRLLNIPEEGFEIVVGFFLVFFSHGDMERGVRADAVYLFDSLATKLGQTKARKCLLLPLIKLYQNQLEGHLYITLMDLSFVKSVIMRLGQGVFIDHFLTYVLEAIIRFDNSDVNTAAKMAVELISQLIPIVGELITLKYIAYPLLGQLTKSQSTFVPKTLMEIAKHLGETMIIRHYIPYLFTLLQKHSSKATKGEEILVTIVQMLEGLIYLLTPSNTLNALVLESTAIFVLLLNPPPNLHFLKSLAKTLLILSYRVGSSHARKHVVPYLRQFFSNYDYFYEEVKSDAPSSPHFSKSPTKWLPSKKRYIAKENFAENSLMSIYCPEMAFLLYGQFQQLVGPTIMKEDIKNSTLIEALMNQFIESEELENSELPSLLKPSIITMSQHDENEIPNFLYSIEQSEDSIRNWTFEGAVATSFRAHNSIIRCIVPSPNESHFVTGSKDHTVKLWKVDQSNPKVVYGDHSHAVSDIKLLNNGNTVASCARAVHVWDLERKTKLFHFEHAETKPFVCVENTKDDKLLLMLNSDWMLSFVDMNSGKLVFQYYLSNFSGNDETVSLCLSDDNMWIAAGSTSGEISLLDARTGYVLEVWKGHDGEVSKLKPFGNNYLISSSADKSMSIWDVSKAPVLVKKVKGHTESVECFDFYKKQIISASGAKIGISDWIDGEEDVLMNMTTLKLHNSKMQPIKSMSVLNYHQLVLFGTDDGTLKICY